jgi:xylulokinase
MDFGTQSVKFVVLNVHDAEIVLADSIDYDTALPHYGTRGGVLPAEDPETRHTSPFMLIEALGLAFDRLNERGIELACVRAAKVDAMQHCTVCADASFGQRLAALVPDENLLPQLGPSISRKTSPIWEDRSPVDEAAYLTKALEEQGSIQALTGNRAELRFPAAQILRWATLSPDEYFRTAHIFLLSSFLTSVLAGKVAPVDTGDGWGTNLNTADIDHPGWSDAAVEAAEKYLQVQEAGSSLLEKLGEMVHYDTVLGRINPYFARRYGIDPEAIVMAGTGDNPATLLGCGGHAVISLGSSYTVNGVMKDVIPSETGEYNVFGYSPGSAMALTVQTNGAKVHESFVDRYIRQGRSGTVTDKDWETYVNAAGEPIILEGEKLMLPYLMDESVPLRPKGIVREGFDEQDARANIRALHISQVLSLKLHSGHLSHPGSVCVVGGAAGNRFLKQLIADVFDARTYTIRHAGFAAALGCAISCARSILDSSYEEAAARFVQVDEASFSDPIRENTSASQTLLQRYEMLERRAARPNVGAKGDSMERTR